MHDICLHTHKRHRLRAPGEGGAWYRVSFEIEYLCKYETLAETAFDKKKWEPDCEKIIGEIPCGCVQLRVQIAGNLLKGRVP